MSDDRTVLEAFRDALVDAMATELSMLRAPREQWEVAAQGVMYKMGVRGMPLIISGKFVNCGDAVLFNRQDRAVLPEVPKESRGEEGEGPVVEVTGPPGGGVQGDGAPGAEGGPA